jgi:hypothetical protein
MMPPMSRGSVRDLGLIQKLVVSSGFDVADPGRDTTCPCAGWAPEHGMGGPPVIQTCNHLLFKCSRFAEACKRHIDCWFYGGLVLLGNLFGDWDGRKRLLGFLTETNTFFKTTPCRLPEHPDTGHPPGAG